MFITLWKASEPAAEIHSVPLDDRNRQVHESALEAARVFKRAEAGLIEALRRSKRAVRALACRAL